MDAAIIPCPYFLLCSPCASSFYCSFSTATKATSCMVAAPGDPRYGGACLGTLRCFLTLALRDPRAMDVVQASRLEVGVDAWRVDEAHRLAARGEQQQKKKQQHQQRTRRLFARADSLRPAVGVRTGGARGEAPWARSRQTKPRTRPTSASCAPPTPALQVWWPACGPKATAWAMPRPRRLSSRGARKRTGTLRGDRCGVCCCGCSSAIATAARRLPRGARFRVYGTALPPEATLRRAALRQVCKGTLESLQLLAAFGSSNHSNLPLRGQGRRATSVTPRRRLSWRTRARRRRCGARWRRRDGGSVVAAARLWAELACGLRARRLPPPHALFTHWDAVAGGDGECKWAASTGSCATRCGHWACRRTWRTPT
jgi:hypothetical protein